MQLKLPFLAAWPRGPVLLPLQGKLGLSVPPPFPWLAESERASEQVKKKHTGLQLFNQSLRLHILISYFQAINRRPTAVFPPLQKISLYILIHGSKKKRFTEIDSQLVPREQCFPQYNQRKKNEKSLLRG